MPFRVGLAGSPSCRRRQVVQETDRDNTTVFEVPPSSSLWIIRTIKLELMYCKFEQFLIMVLLGKPGMQKVEVKVSDPIGLKVERLLAF